MEKNLLSYLTPITAVGLATIAAIISIIGMSKLFSGQETIVMVVMGFIEFGKIISTSILHNNWVNKQYNKIRWFLLTMVLITMLITSLGVYGFFTDAYQKTSNKLSINNSEIVLVENKKKLIGNRIDNIKSQIEFKEKQSNKLLSLRDQQESRLDSLIKNRNFTTAKRTQELINSSNDDLKSYQNEIQSSLVIINNLNDSLSRLDIEILEKTSNNEASSKLGPLMYISSLVNKDMDLVVNYLMLLIMIVFDPLAILLILVTNKMWSKNEIHQNTQESKIVEETDMKTTNVENETHPHTPETKIVEETDINDMGEDDFSDIIEEDFYDDLDIPKQRTTIIKEETPIVEDKNVVETQKLDNETWRNIYLKRRKKNLGDNSIKRF